MEQVERIEIVANKPQSFPIIRYFSLASLAAIVAAAILLMLTYRQLAVDHLVELSKSDASTLALSLFNSVRREFMRYLNDETAHHLQPLPDALKDAIGDLMRDTRMTDVRILDDEGIVVFATRAGDMGRALAADPDAARALEGGGVSRLASHNSFWPFANPVEGSNLQSYVPIQAELSGRVLGVFVVDTDVTPLIAEIERTKFTVFSASALILLALYLVLLVIARHAERMVQRSEGALQKRSSALVLLSQQLITVQEDEKQRIAYELHEGIAQTMCALKLQLEGLCSGAGRRSVPCTRLTKTLVPVIQDMVQSTRTLAEDIRPSTLSQFGVLQTLDWYFRQFRQAHPSLQLEWVTSLNEVEIAKPLKTTLFRLVEDVTKYVVREDSAKLLRVNLSKTFDKIVLEVSDDGSIAKLDATRQAERRSYLVTLEEHISITGGIGRTSSNNWGGTTLHAEWST